MNATSSLLVLNGFMGTGKSTVGRLVAEARHAEFLDLDTLVEQRTGVTVSALFRERGEAAFRAVEREILLDSLDDAGPRVLALGGGALVDRETRLRVLEGATVVTLQASIETVLGRCGGDPTRPLLGPPDAVRALWESRRAAYAEAHARIPTDGLTANAVAAAVLDAWERDAVPVAAGEESYVVELSHGGAHRGLAEALGHIAGSAGLLVSDGNVAPLHADALVANLSEPLERVVLTPGEQNKTITEVERIWLAAQSAGVDRQGVLVGLGGGVVTDMTGFAAATWLRGIRWIGVPTTLLSMVDASVGGKTGVDLGEAKNAVGAFWQPAHVLCDVAHLATETDRGFRSALSEVIKTALIGDPGLLDTLDAQSERVLKREPGLLLKIVRRSIRVKARVVSRDPREAGLRATLNLGHTLGHAFEAHGGYGALMHGEAISLGLVAALRLGEHFGLTPAELTARVTRSLSLVGLPTDLGTVDLHGALALLGHDKKRVGDSVRFVFARAPGDVVVQPVELAELRRASTTLA